MPRRNLLLDWLLVIALACSIAATAQDRSSKPSTQENTPTYGNPNLTVDDRFADLLPRLTLEEEEKVGQIAPLGEGKTQIISPVRQYLA
jgi:hypothetical protein